jgi:hypothetical protein
LFSKHKLHHVCTFTPSIYSLRSFLINAKKSGWTEEVVSTACMFRVDLIGGSRRFEILNHRVSRLPSHHTQLQQHRLPLK